MPHYYNYYATIISKKGEYGLTNINDSVILIRLKTQKNPKSRSLWGSCKSLILLIELVAGVGFEPTTFRLWAWRATGLLHPASCFFKNCCKARRPGNDLLSHTLRCSTISATELHVRVRNGIGWDICTIITRPSSLTILRKWSKYSLLFITRVKNTDFYFHDGHDQADRTISTS